MQILLSESTKNLDTLHMFLCRQETVSPLLQVKQIYYPLKIKSYYVSYIFLNAFKTLKS